MPGSIQPRHTGVFPLLDPPFHARESPNHRWIPPGKNLPRATHQPASGPSPPQGEKRPEGRMRGLRVPPRTDPTSRKTLLHLPSLVTALIPIPHHTPRHAWNEIVSASARTASTTSFGGHVSVEGSSDQPPSCFTTDAMRSIRLGPSALELHDNNHSPHKIDNRLACCSIFRFERSPDRT